MLEKINLLDASLHPQIENAPHPFRRTKFTHPILPDDVVSSRRREQKKGSFPRFTNAIRNRKSLGAKRDCREHQYAQTHYQELLHKCFSFWRGGEVASLLQFSA